MRSFLFIALIAIFLAACGAPVESEADAQEILIAAELRSYWTENGGTAVFGPPLAPARNDGGLIRQTFLNVELVYDPASRRVRLAPLGRTLGLAEPAEPPPADSSLYFESTGHQLYPGFARSYRALGGQATLGAPISSVHFSGGRILQYFENAGLYRDETAPPTEVKFVALGVAIRAGQEPELASDNRLVVPDNIFSRPFGLFLDRYGGEAIFGRPLTEPYLAPDGSVEQIYERAIIYSPADAPGEVRLRPVGLASGPAEPSVPPAEEPESRYFEETGHNVRWAFLRFYLRYGAERLIGLPLEEADLDQDTLRQRFENAILIYRFDLPAALAVQLAPVGREYLLDRSTPTPPPPTQASTPTGTAATLEQVVIFEVTTWVEQEMIAPGSPQRIWIRILDANGRPVGGAQPILALNGRRDPLYPFVERTNAEGVTSVELTLDDLAPGEIVNYEIAVAEESGIGHAFGQFFGGPANP